MQQSNKKMGFTQAKDPRFKWLFYAIIFLAFSNLWLYAQDWFDIDPKRESRVLNNIYYAANGLFQALVVYAGVKARVWFSTWIIPLLIFYVFAFLVLASFVLFESEDWNIDLPFVTRTFFILCGLGCVVITILDFIRWRQKS